MKEKMLSLMLCLLLLVGTLTGCGQSEKGAESSEVTSSSQEVVTINVSSFTVGPTTDYQNVVDAINKISEAKIGVRINLNIYELGQWIQQYSMLTSGSEDIDLMPSYYTQVTGAINSGALMPLDELYAQYGKDIDAVLGSFVDAGKYSGALYGIPSQHEYASYPCIIYNKDITDKLNIDVSNIKTLKDWEVVLKVVKEKYPDMYPLYAENNTICLSDSYFNWDNLGNGLGVIMYDGDEKKIVNLYETEEYKELVTLMHEWSQIGYVSPDAAVSTDSYVSLSKTGNAFSYLFRGNAGTAEEYTTNCESNQGVIIMGDTYATTSGINSVTWGIPSTSKKSEAAMKFLNLCYSDPEISNLLNYGVEGTNYKVKESGQYTFVDGESATNSKYWPNATWVWPNGYIAGEWEGTLPGIGEKMTLFNNNALKSPALGFNFSSDNVANELTACSNVQKQYVFGLEAGSVDVESTLAKFNQALKAAGIDTVIAEKQKQYDEFLANRNK